MKIKEIADVVPHPAVKRKETFDNLLMSNDHDDIIAFIMDDNNTESRRLALLKRLDLMLGNAQKSYSVKDLDDFMNDQGPSDWQSNLRKQLKKYGAEGKSYSWSRRKEHPPGTQYDFSKLDDMSEEEMINFAKDLKIPPYHLSSVDETQDEDAPAGEYEICQRCGGEGCIECEEGLKDITGMHKVPDFSKYDDPTQT